MGRFSLEEVGLRVMGNASRATLREFNDKPLWGEAKELDVLKSETHTGVEVARNYGFTSVPVKQDPEEGGKPMPPQARQPGDPDMGEQPKGAAAEAIVLYLNGSRSHPVVIAMGDRRHRLYELEEGDSAQYRLRDDRQQILMHKDGTYISTRDDKQLRLALVPKPEAKPTSPPPAPAAVTAMAAAPATGAGGGTDGSDGGGAKDKDARDKEKYGQKSARDDNLKSVIYIEQTNGVTTIRHSSHYSAVRGDDASMYHGDRKKSMQVTDEHSHLRTGDFRIYTDDGGCWSDVPMLVRKDGYCKE